MPTCPRCQTTLKTELTLRSVIVDHCPQCKGTWLDGGEIFALVANRERLAEFERTGLQNPQPVPERCPRCSLPMQAGCPPGFRYQIEQCSACQGLWLDQHEYQKLGASPLVGHARAAQPLGPKLRLIEFTSWGLLGSLYALLFAIVVALMQVGAIPARHGLSFLVGFVLLQFWLGPWVIDWSLRLWGSLEWIDRSRLPPHLAKRLTEICAHHRIPEPRIGLIHDGSPQAYTYGRTPWSARLVLSQGILDALSEDELEAVLAHELGHIVHWDFVAMTAAQLVPILLYQLYRWGFEAAGISRRTRTKNSGGKAKSAILVAAIAAYIAYWLAQLLVQAFSRAREYWADQFSATHTGRPRSLVRALLKISYGAYLHAPTASAPDDPAQTLLGSREKQLGAVQALGIVSVRGSKQMALLAAQDDTPFDEPERLIELMRWDLVSPWARYFELFSTHPLTARRILALSQLSHQMGQGEIIPRGLSVLPLRWSGLVRDALIYSLPLTLGVITWLLASVGIHPSLRWLATSIGVAIGGLIQTSFCYRTDRFVPHQILSLLKILDVSPVTSYPVELSGRVLGRGDAGNRFSEDLLLRDAHGAIFLDYEQPLGVLNLWFALFRLQDYVGTDVVVRGWYRRGPIPYVEVRSIASQGRESRCYTYEYRMAAFLLLPLLAGLMLSLT